MKKNIILDKGLYILVGLVWMTTLSAGCAAKNSTEDAEDLLFNPQQEVSTVSQEEVEAIEEEVIDQEEEVIATTGNDKVETEDTPTEAIQPASTGTTSQTTESQITESQTQEVTTVYKAGTYSSVGAYQSPVGAESIQVQLTVSNDVVTGVSVTRQAVDPGSQYYQDLFISGINSLVVGKPIDSISQFSNVNGSSLTPAGFQSALDSIKVQAKS